MRAKVAQTGQTGNKLGPNPRMGHTATPPRDRLEQLQGRVVNLPA